MYSILYDSMMSWYARRRVASEYRHQYAITTVTSTGFANIISLMVLAAKVDLPLGTRT